MPPKTRKPACQPVVFELYALGEHRAWRFCHADICLSMSVREQTARRQSIDHKVRTFFVEIGEFLFALIKHWRAALTSSLILSVGWTVYSLISGKAMQLDTYLWSVFAVSVPVAVFAAWAAEYRGRLDAEQSMRLADANSNELLLREQIRLRQLVDNRDHEFADLRDAVGALRSQVAPRRLTDAQAKMIAATARSDLRDHIKDLPPSFAQMAALQRIKMSVVSIGDESETINYRNDFAKAFEAAGFDVNTPVWPAGLREFDDLAGCVTLLLDKYQLPNADPNRVRAIVAASLNAAAVEFRENTVEGSTPNTETIPGTEYPGACLVIGQRA